MTKQQLIDSIYGYLYREFNTLKENVGTDGESIWVDTPDGNYSVMVIECDKENDNDNNRGYGNVRYS